MRHDWESTTRRVLPALSPAIVQVARGLPSATLHEAAGKTGALPSAIKPVASGMRLCGPALTVHGPGGDNLWLHRALEVARPGDVVVAHVGGAHEHGYWGEIMTGMALARGLGGLVIDGCVRDGELLRGMNFPVFARGLCIRGTGKDFGAPGWINHPVRIGEVTVCAGDLVVADDDGVFCAPADGLDELVRKAQAREADEARILQRIRAGESTLDIYGLR